MAHKVKLQILKQDISKKVFWTDVSEPLPLKEAQTRLSHYEKQYPENRYQIVTT